MDPDWKDEDEAGEFDDHDPTLADCIRLWHQGIEWHKHDTVLGIREFAACTSETGPTCETARRTWIESVQQLRASGLFDVDTSYNIIHHIVEESLDYEAYSTDYALNEIGDRMEALCRAHGLPEFTDFSSWSNPPAEWTALEREYDERQAEMRNAILRAAGEHDMIALMLSDPAEFERRTAVVEARIKRDHDDERARWMPKSGV